MTAQVSFWERRRAAVEAEEQADLQAEEVARATAVQEEIAEKDDETVLKDMGLPDPDGMQAGDDFAAFMAQEVPQHLRNKALRKLWRSNPVLACVDGLNEYDDDYRAAMLAGEPIKTAYQVGKGMMAHIEEMARQEEAAKASAVAEDVQEDDENEVEHEVVQEEEAPQDVAEPIEADMMLAREEPVIEAPAPRRMRFRFEEVHT